MTRKLTEGEKLQRFFKRLFFEHIVDPVLVFAGVKHAAWKPKNRSKKIKPLHQEHLPGEE